MTDDHPTGDLSECAQKWDRALEHLVAWLWAPPHRGQSAASRSTRSDGVREAERLCRSFRTPSPRADAEDVAMQAWRRIHRRRSNAVAEGADPPNNIIGYAVTTMRNVISRAYGSRGGDDGSSLSGFDADAYSAPPAVGSGAPAAAARRVGRIRSAIEAASIASPLRSAALSYLTLGLSMEGGDADAIDIDDLPWPRSGARPDQARMWPCAFLATRDASLFPGDIGAGAAQRKRLSRFCTSALDVVRDAAVEAGT